MTSEAKRPGAAGSHDAGGCQEAAGTEPVACRAVPSTRKGRMRLVHRAPCYCQICDAPAVLVKATHELPGYSHIEFRLALCDRHAERLASLFMLYLQRQRARQRKGATPSAAHTRQHYTREDD